MSESMRSKTWILLPAFNEARYIERVLDKLTKVTPNIIVINDGSSDTTRQLAEKHCSQVISHATNLGKGAALKTGCEYAFDHLDAEAVIFFDSDDQHNTDELQLFFSELEQGAKIVLGVRSFDQRMPLTRIIMNRLGSVLMLLLFGQYIPDIPSGFKAIHRSVYPKLAWNSTDYAVEMEIAARIARFRLPYTTVPIETIYHDLDRGMNVLHTIRMVTKVISWRFSL